MLVGLEVCGKCQYCRLLGLVRVNELMVSTSPNVSVMSLTYIIVMSTCSCLLFVKGPSHNNSYESP